MLQINKFRHTESVRVNYKVSCRNKQNSQVFAHKSFVFPTHQTNVNSNRIEIIFHDSLPLLVHFLFIRIKNIYSAETIKIFSYNNPIVLANPRSRGKILFHPIKLATEFANLVTVYNPVYISSFSLKKQGRGRGGGEKKSIPRTIRIIKIHVENIRLYTTWYNLISDSAHMSSLSSAAMLVHGSISMRPVCQCDAFSHTYTHKHRGTGFAVWYTRSCVLFYNIYPTCTILVKYPTK